MADEGRKPRLPKVHVIEVTEEDGELFASPVTSPICDFCADIGPKWSYGCEDFLLPEIPSPWGPGCWASTGGFAACEDCSRLIDGRFLPELTGRILRGASALSIDKVGLLVQGFFDHMTGEKEAWG